MATLALWLLTPLTEIEVSGLIVRLSSCLLLVWLIMTVFWRAPMLGGTLLTSLCALITLLAFGATGTTSVTLVHIIAVAPVGTAPMLVGAAPLCVGEVLPVGQVGVDTVDSLTGPPYNVSGICGIGNTTVVTGLDRAGVPPVGVVAPLVNLTGLGGTTTLVAQQVVAGAEDTPTTTLHGAGTWNTSVTGNVTVTVGIAASACPAVGDVVPLLPLSAPSGTSTYHSPLNVSTCPCFDIWNPPLNDGVSTSTASIAIGGAPCGLAVVPRGAPDAKSTLETRPIEWLGALLQGVNSDPWVSSRAPVSLKGVMARLGNVNKICAWEGVWPEGHQPVGGPTTTAGLWWVPTVICVVFLVLVNHLDTLVILVFKGGVLGAWVIVWMLATSVLRLFNVVVFVHGFVPKWVVQPVLQRVTTLPHTVLLFGTFLVFCVNLSPVEAVQCGHCFEEGHASGDCPLITGVAANVTAIAAATTTAITITALLPAWLLRLFPRSILQSIATLARRNVIGAVFDLSGKKPSEIIQAIQDGLTTRREAIRHVAVDLDDEAKRDAAHALLGTIAKLDDAVVASAAPVGSIQGAFRFILAKVSYYVVAAQNSAFMLDVVQSVSAESSSCQHITAKMHHPKTEAQFFEMLHLWSLVVHSVGLANTVVVQLFIHEVVFRTIRMEGFTWMLAYELFLVYLGNIEEQSELNLNLANVVSKLGGQDTKIKQAELLGKEHYGSLFKARGQSARGPGDIDSAKPKQWNGQFNKNSTLTCHSFNNEKEHPAASLDADGRCKFNHICDKALKDGGKCKGNHCSKHCTNPNRVLDPK